MENKIKQRIVGALVLIGLVTVILAILLHNGSSPDKKLMATMQTDAAQKAVSPKVEIIFSDQAHKVDQKRQELSQTQEQQFVQPKPPLQTLALAQPQQPTREVVEKLPSVTVKHSISASANSKPTEKAKIEGRRLNTENQRTEVWAIQMGSFRDKVLAFRLENRLKQRGFKTYIHRVSGRRGTAYNVIVGTIKQKEEAKKLQHKLANMLNLHGFLIRAV